MNLRLAWLIMAIGLFACTTNAQNVVANNPVSTSAAEQVINNYQVVLADQLEIFNGYGYHFLPQGQKGSAYFGEKAYFNPAVIQYNGNWYKNIPVLYDIYADAMVSQVQDSMFVLRAEKISDIYFSEHHFIHFNTPKGENINAGYYDQLYNGRSEVLVKRIRTVQNNVTSQSVEVLYENRDVIYLKKGDNYIKVYSKSSVLDVFKDKSKQIKQFLKDNHIAYKEDVEGSIVKLATYYDQIAN